MFIIVVSLAAFHLFRKPLQFQFAVTDIMDYQARILGHYAILTLLSNNLM